jgi:hypothetical protein
MEIRVYTIKYTPPRWLKGLIVCILPAGALLLGGATAVWANVDLTTFTPNTPIRSADVNANFSNLNNAVSALQGQVVPAGMIAPFGGTSAPAGWLTCDGSSVARATYPALFSAVGTTWGTADSAHFNLPDLRGRFIRGADSGGSSRDPGPRASCSGGGAASAAGSCETDAFQGWMPQIITRSGSDAASLSQATDYVLYSSTGLSGAETSNIYRPDKYAILPYASYGTPRVSTETRPANVAVTYVVKY